VTVSGSDPTAELKIDVDPDAAFYWQGAGEGRLLAQRCVACDRLWHPPGPVCPRCQCLEFTIDELPLDGLLYCAAKVHEPGSPIQGTGYVIGLVEFADPRHPSDVVRIAANVRDATLDEARVGAPVVVHFERLAGDHALPQFRLDERSTA
jgi:uncharacterized OB-fold protein